METSENPENPNPKTTEPTGQPDVANETETDATSAVTATKNTPEPVLSVREKIGAGILIVTGMVIAFIIIIMFWPNSPPTVENNTYCYRPFHVTLITELPKPTPAITNGDSAKKTDNTKKDTTKKDTAKAKKLSKTDTTAVKVKATIKVALCKCATIQYGALILILVAAFGFLGNMVYVASSFTAFVGAETFKRSWAMWYVVKPFTASGLAVFLYLALNSSTISPQVNLNGIMAAAALAGLFTDIATQKLKEIFTAAFKPSDNRPDKLTDGKTTVDLANMHPEKIDVNQVNNFLIPGQNLDPKNTIVSINGTNITPATVTVTPTLIKFPYIVTNKTLTKFTLLITDSKGVKIDGKDLGV